MNLHPGELASPGFFLSLKVHSVILQVQQLSKHYPDSPQAGLEPLSFQVKAGEILAIIGESGSGKSTLLKCIYGLLTPDTGEILFEGKHVKGPTEQLVPGHLEMKMVAQDFALNTYAKVYDNVASMLSNTNVAAKESNTLKMLANLHLMHVKDKRAIELSGGEQQRVAIAKALISKAKMLLFDEPFSQIDTLLKNQLRSEIKQIAKAQGKSVILVSHDPADGLSLADKVLILKKGQLMAYGSKDSLYENPPNLYTAQMLGHAQSLPQNQALALGIDSSRGIYFYPEWVKLFTTAESHQINPQKRRSFEITYMAFKGHYSELTLVSGDIRIRAYDYFPQRHKKSDLVYIELNRFFQI
ncbi:MAG: ATP-binding cassette domain-containing protein [Pedobacter sp.]|nr:MAG: ATP-binding cassette domain-containing protein [Pedobacter sp.]